MKTMVSVARSHLSANHRLGLHKDIKSTDFYKTDVAWQYLLDINIGKEKIYEKATYKYWIVVDRNFKKGIQMSAPQLIKYAQKYNPFVSELDESIRCLEKKEIRIIPKSS